MIRFFKERLKFMLKFKTFCAFNFLNLQKIFVRKNSSFLIVFLLMFFSCLGVKASQLPRYLGTEKKFRSYIYNPNDVYRYLGHYTYQGFIEFGEDETINTISMGDPSLWLFEHLGNRLFLKPVGDKNSETNMTVISNKKIYHFELTAKEAKNINDKDLIFVAKFSYPDEKDKNIIEFPKVIASDEPDMRDISIYNFSYQFTGETSIAPIKVFDNGEFTYLQFPKKNAEVPAVFAVDAAGFESLVNFRAAGEYIIIEKVAPQFTLRSGSDVVCIYNMAMYSDGKIVDPYQKKKSKDNPPVVNSFAPPASSSSQDSQQNQGRPYPSSAQQAPNQTFAPQNVIRRP